MTVMGIVDNIRHMTMPGQVPLGLSGLIIAGIPEIVAVDLAFGCARLSLIQATNTMIIAITV